MQALQVNGAGLWQLEDGGLMVMGYDQKCGELAVKFLEDHFDPIPESKVDELAQVIQDAIEDWLRGEDLL